MALSINAIKEAKENNIIGKDSTPFLLGKIKELTGGKSLVANIELVKHNAKVGAQIAVSFNNKTKIILDCVRNLHKLNFYKSKITQINWTL